MAEYCYGCYKKYLNGKMTERELIISNYLDLCEGCADYKNVVIRRKTVLELIFSMGFKR